MTINVFDTIVSSNLNRNFATAEHRAQYINIYDKSYVNQVISFQGLGLNSLYTDPEAYTQYWRCPDDMDVIGICVDVFGVDQMGIFSRQGSGAFPPPVGSCPNALSANFKIEVRGNFTALDEEEGYPQIYKSSEFNMVTDIDLDYDSNGEPVLPQLNYTSTSPNPLAMWGVDLLQGDNGLHKRLFYPVDENEILLSFLRGAQYIFTLSAKDQVANTVSGQTARECHDVSAVNATFICRSTTRRYS